MNMIEGKTEVAELKPETLQVVERLEEDVDVDLFSKTVVSVVGDEQHGHPVMACVTRNLFRVTTTYNSHNFCISCRVFEGQANACRTRQKRYCLVGEKGDATFHLMAVELFFWK
jgi:hypothetical protein